VGSASYISRKLGERDMAEARHTCASSFYITTLIGVLTTILVMIFKEQILGAIGTSQGTYRSADDYFTIITLFSVILIQNISLQGQVRSEGAARHAMIGMTLGIGLNILLDPLFILVLDWGVKGAAWATILGCVAGCGYFFYFLFSRHSLLSIRPADMKPNRHMLAEILKIGVPAALSHVLMSVSGILSNLFAASYGDHVVAAAGINMRVCSLAFTLVFGIAMGFQPFAGYNYGAKNYRRLTRGLQVTISCATASCILFTLIFLFFGREIILFFIDEKNTVEAGAKMLTAFVFGMPFLGVQVTMQITFQSLGKSLRATFVTVGRQCVIFIPLLFILNHLFGFDGFVFTQPVADIVTTAFSVIMGVTLFRTLLRDPAAK
jgi:putative MATE family efflux protein